MIIFQKFYDNTSVEIVVQSFVTEGFSVFSAAGEQFPVRGSVEAGGVRAVPHQTLLSPQADSQAPQVHKRGNLNVCSSRK